jgi:hypothetical protein
MRWDHLFDDLESQLEHELGAEELDVLAEEERLRLGRLALRDRLRAVLPGTVRLALADGTRLALALGAVGRDWVAGEEVRESGTGASCVVPTASIAACFLDPAQTAASLAQDAAAASPVGSLAARLGLAFVLRDLCRRRAALSISTAAERLHGTIDRVGRDHLDLAEHDPGVARRDRDVRALRIVPIGQIVLVRF